MNRPDIVLLFPTPSKESPTMRPALGIFCVGAMLERHGYNVEYHDERFDSPERLKELLRAKPLALGISSMTGYQLVGAKNALELAKELSPETTTILGGVHFSILPEETFQEGNVHYIVFSEGEQTCLEIVQALKEGGDPRQVPGLWYQDDDGQVCWSGKRAFMDPKDWPFPYTEKTKRYYKLAAANGGEIIYQTSRGCPFACRFCYNLITSRRSWRAAPMDKVRRELSVLTSELDFDNMLLCDDHLGPNMDRLVSLSEVFSEFNIRWYSSIRIDAVTVDLLEKLKAAGCEQLLLGIESGSDRILREVIGKKTTVEAIKRCTVAFAQAEVRGRYNFIHGLPGDTLKDLYASMDLVDWISEHDPKGIVAFDAYAPYPGTELYQDAVNQGFNPPTDLIGWSSMTLSNPLDPIAENMFYIVGLRTRGRKGDITSRNFPGLYRLLILPFELGAKLRWRMRWVRGYGLEKRIVKRLFRWAATRRRRRTAAQKI